MGIFSKKRGNLIEMLLSPMFLLLIVLTLVFLPLLKYTSDIGKSSYYEREFLSRDVGLMIAALQASPNDAMVNYGEKTYGLYLLIKPGSVQAYSDDPESSKARVSSFQLIPSKLRMEKFSFGPKTEKDQEGEEVKIPFRLTLKKEEIGRAHV